MREILTILTDVSVSLSVCHVALIGGGACSVRAACRVRGSLGADFAKCLWLLVPKTLQACGS